MCSRYSYPEYGEIMSRTIMNWEKAFLKIYLWPISASSMIHYIIITFITLICFIILPIQRNSWLFPINCSFVGNNFLERCIDMFCCKSRRDGFHPCMLLCMFLLLACFCFLLASNNVLLFVPFNQPSCKKASNDTICISLLDPAAKLFQIGNVKT